MQFVQFNGGSSENVDEEMCGKRNKEWDGGREPVERLTNHKAGWLDYRAKTNVQHLHKKQASMQTDVVCKCLIGNDKQAFFCLFVCLFLMLYSHQSYIW